MSSTTGIRTGDTLHEIHRLRKIMARHRRRAAWMERSRDYWRVRARAAERATR